MKTRSFFFIFFLTIVIPISAQIRIKGKILDEKDQPLEGASVYLNNTTKGTTTNDLGEFELLINEGIHDLIVSYIGYQTLQYQIDTKNPNKFFVFKTTPVANMLDEIVLNKKKYSAEERAYFMGRFKSHFIGYTNLAKDCKILNEHVIDFDFNSKTKILEASVSKPIIIKHKSLGYTITYDLVHFQLEPKKVSFLGYTRYQNMKGSRRKKRKWRENRKVAYNGSIMHFLRSLTSNSIQKNGFIIDHFKRIPNPDRPSEEKIKTAIELIKLGGSTTGIVIDLSNTQITPMTTVDSSRVVLRRARLKKFIDVPIKKNILENEIVSKNQKGHTLSFTHFLKIKYTKEPEEDNYRPGVAKLDYQVSIITLYVKNTIIDKSGVLVNPLDMFVEGYWSYEKIADSLPLDYDPKE